MIIAYLQTIKCAIMNKLTSARKNEHAMKTILYINTVSLPVESYRQRDYII